MKRLAVAVLACLLLSACGPEKRRELAAFHHPTAESMQVRLTWHANSREALAAAHAEARTLRESTFVAHLVGTSNGYNWGEAFAVQVRTEANRLQVGQLISFRDQFGRITCHPIVGRDSLGWITAGTANPVADRGRVTDANLVARVVSVHSWQQAARRD